MAKIDITVPELSESVSEATVLGWKVKAGDWVAADDVLVELETDKVVLEVSAPEDGVVADVLAKEGDVVKTGDALGHMDAGAKKGEAAAPAPEAPKAEAPAAEAAPAPAPQARVMPSAAKAAAEAGINAAALSGTGAGGRVTKADVAAAAAAAKPAPAPKAAPAAPAPKAPAASAPAPVPFTVSGSRPEERVPMSRLRSRVAERLLQSQQSAAILTTFQEVNMGPVIELRKRLKEDFEKRHGIRLGFMSFFVKAAVAALRKFPVINASIDGNDIVYHGYFDISVAVDSPRGLVVPVIRDADRLSFAGIERQIRDFADRAKSGRLTIEEMTGGTFTVSNGGVFGSLFSTPIINPPQSAILGIHATRERPWVENGEIVIRPVSYFALSYDHRLIDGREAVQALYAIKTALEDPATLLLDL